MTASAKPPNPTTSTTSAGAVEQQHHLTPSQAADYLNLPENALAKMRLTGLGPPFVKIVRRVRYGRAALDAWLRERTYSNTACVAQNSGATHDR